MTSHNLQNPPVTQSYHSVVLPSGYQEGNWKPSGNSVPIVPARGIKRSTPAECGQKLANSGGAAWRSAHEGQSERWDAGVVHGKELNVPQPPYSVANMNQENDAKTNLGGNVSHDLNTNRIHNWRSDPKLNSMPWFHGMISREHAEQILQPRTDGLFLVRESTNFPGDYTLCVCWQNKVEHYRVKYHEKHLTIDDEEYFENLSKLIEHYQKDADGLCTQLVNHLPKERNNSKESKFFMDPKAFEGCLIPEQELEFHEPLGKGEFGEVLLGLWKGKRVAIKMLKDSGEAAKKFFAEAQLMKSLQHENLVSLLGVVWNNKHIYLVTEYMSKGSLVDYLRSRGRLHVTRKDQINFAYDTSSGMGFLEEMHIVHRDLAARNVLIAENGVAKVSDFGLARLEKFAPETAKLPIKWTAPEALKHNKFSNKSDMWSFGILLWEIYSFGRVPYPRIPLADVVKHVEKGYKMEAPEGCPPEVYEIMRQAWDLLPERRPTFAEVKSKLMQLKNTTT